MEGHEEREEVLFRLRRKHRLISATRCACSWEGDDAIIHVIDALHAEGFTLTLPISVEEAAKQVAAAHNNESMEGMFKLHLEAAERAGFVLCRKAVVK